jgi:hypothetical protein
VIFLRWLKPAATGHSFVLPEESLNLGFKYLWIEFRFLKLHDVDGFTPAVGYIFLIPDFALTHARMEKPNRWLK